MSEIHLLGIAGERPDPDFFRIVEGCVAVVAATRHRQLIADPDSQIIPIAPVQAMLENLAAALQKGNVAVLASGDPLFFGIGRTLVERFGREQVRVYPALSSMQLACARLGEPWDDIHFLSLHGRTADYLPGMILQYPKVMLLTDHHNSPDIIAGRLLDALLLLNDRERIDSVEVMVVENAGLSGERASRGTLQEIAASNYAPLNLMFIKQSASGQEPGFGLTEDEITHSRGLITKDEVRAVVLHQLRLPASGVFWDVGAGSGSIAVTAARLHPDLQVYAVEKRTEELKNITTNIINHQTYNVQPIAGTAPQALENLPDPNRVFIGGSGGELENIIRHCASCLSENGWIVVNSVIAKTARLAPEILDNLGFTVDLREIAVSRWQYNETRRTTMNPITIITGRK